MTARCSRAGVAGSLRRTLREALADAATDSGILHGARASLPLAALAGLGPLGRHAEKLAGRSAVLIASDQFAASLAMVDLDALAARMVLCPPDLSPDHLAAVAAATGAHALVFDGAPPANPPAGLDLIAFDPLDLADCSARGAGPGAEWVMFTSGTTGVPKLVGHDLAGLTGAFAGGAAGGEPTVWSTFYDIRRYGGLQILLRAMFGGASMVLSEAGEPAAAFLERLGRRGVTHISGTPSHWRRALMSGRAGAIAPKVIRLSGEIADQAVLDALKAAWPDAKIGHAYASTEAGVGFEVTDGLEGFPAELVEHGAGAVDLRVVEGSLRVRSDRMAHGYVGVDGMALVDVDGFIDTGDLVERRGARWHFLGRRNGVINVGGLKVNPEEVEAVINRHPSVAMSLVRARRSPITGAIVVADVVAGADAVVADEAELRQSILTACRRDLAPFKTPASIRFVPDLAIGANGKVLRAHV
jgi:acyl-coenzyme A synthetase/AMP-(fatty) acid ligase